jgi:hypothetical protein
MAARRVEVTMTTTDTLANIDWSAWYERWERQ